MYARGSGNRFAVTFHGVRGSRPAPEEGYQKFGGHTSCIEVSAGGARLILDAGTGLVRASRSFAETDGPVDLFLSHLHHDHVMGFMFFRPVYEPGRVVRVHVAEGKDAPFARYWQDPYFPTPLSGLPSRIEVRAFGRDARWAYREGAWTPVDGQASLGDPVVSSLRLGDEAHPGGVELFRVEFEGRSVAYVTDAELSGDPLVERVAEFCSRCDCLICDAHFADAEYADYRGWGHNSVENAVRVAEAARAKRLILFHHAPGRRDDDLASLEEDARRRFPESSAAREGVTIYV